MCLTYEKKLTKQKLDYFIKHNIKEIIVWKVLCTSNKRKRYYSIYQGMKYKKGKNIPDTILKYFNPNNKEQFIGKNVLHVFVKRSIARNKLSWNRRVIRCRVKVQDIIAYGKDNDIAVKALYIDKFSERK